MDEGLLAPLFPVDVTGEGQSTPSAAGSQIEASAQDEAVQPVGRLRVVFPHAVVDKHGYL